MTPLLERALERIDTLPQAEQDAIASEILDSLDNEEHWRKRFALKVDVIRRMAREALDQDERGLTRPFDELL